MAVVVTVMVTVVAVDRGQKAKKRRKEEGKSSTNQYKSHTRVAERRRRRRGRRKQSGWKRSRRLMEYNCNLIAKRGGCLAESKRGSTWFCSRLSPFVTNCSHSLISEAAVNCAVVLCRRRCCYSVLFCCLRSFVVVIRHNRKGEGVKERKLKSKGWVCNPATWKRDTRDSVDAQLKEIDLIGAMTAKGRQKKEGKAKQCTFCFERQRRRYGDDALSSSAEYTLNGLSQLVLVA